jgi:DNA invertase Pin-like site-specific DNA recombinase
MSERVAIYARVSTSEQTVENQLRDLRQVCERHGWLIVGEFCDQGVSGALGQDERKALSDLMKSAMRREFDRVVVWSVDRLARSLKHLVLLLEDLKDKGINVYSHKQGLDTSTPSGVLMWKFLGIFSEFEREIIRERVRSGLRRAKANGKVLGRPRLSQTLEKKILALRRRGFGKVKIGRTLGVGTSQVQRVLGCHAATAS